MDFNKIESFVTIVEMGSITKAAEKLYLSQSTISDRLAALEEELDTQLIQRGRGNKKLELTEKGVEFLDFAARYLELNNEIDDWKNMRLLPQLKVSAPQSVNTYLLRDFYKDHLTDTPHLDVSSHWNRTIYNMVYSFDMDIGIVSRPYQSKQVMTKSLIEEPLFIIYDKRFANYDALSELEKPNQIYIGWGPAYEKWYDRHWDENQPTKITLDSPELLMDYLESEDAWAIVPLCIYRELIHKNSHIEMVSTDSEIHRTLYLVYQTGHTESRNQLLQYFIQDLYTFILELETNGLCKVLMNKPEKINVTL